MPVIIVLLCVYMFALPNFHLMKGLERHDPDASFISRSMGF